MCRTEQQTCQLPNLLKYMGIIYKNDISIKMTVRFRTPVYNFEHFLHEILQ